jgi:hypothetical protein
MAKRPETPAAIRLLRCIKYLDYDAYDAPGWYRDGATWAEVLAEIEDQATEKARAECEGLYFSGL